MRKEVGFFAIQEKSPTFVPTVCVGRVVQFG